MGVMSMFHLLQLEGRLQDNLGLLITPLLLLILLVVVLQRFGFRKSQKLPPGPWPWPVVGNLFMLGKSPHISLARFAEQYGPLVYLRLGSTHTVVASSPALAKEFLKTQDHVFQARPASLAFNILTNNSSMGVISGSTLRHVRRICVNELLTTKRLQLFQPMRTAEIHAMIQDIYVEAQEDKVIDLNFKLSSLATNNITQMLFRKRYCGVGTNQRETQWFKETFEEIFHWYGVFIIADYIPYLKWVTKLQGIDASLQALHTKISTFLQQIIDEHRRNPNVDDNYTVKDFVDVLLTMPQEDGTGHLSDDTIQAIITDMLAAGLDTSYVTLEWVMAELLRHPDIMKRAQEELDTVVGSNRLVSESDLQHLPYLQAILKETFRIHPPAPIMVPYRSIQPCQVEGYNLPTNIQLIVNLWAMGRDPNNWEKPLEFDPDRFILQHPKIDVHGQDFELLPFGTGRRACPGRPLGILFVQIVLASLLQSFDWTLPPNLQQEPMKLDMSETFNLILKKTQGLCAKAHPRLHPHFYH
ncbi:hypothetical protein CY35_03G057600 [Sphagnum magellanicum]|nr:hypothetical protein CY35_03G057600 [Sphagnum magellanicum]